MDFKGKTEKEIITWLFEHPIWTHDMPIRKMRFVKCKDKKGYSEVQFYGKPKIERIGGEFYECVTFFYHYVNPKTGRIDKNHKKNTKFQIWAEGGGWCDLSVVEPQNAPKEGYNDYNKWIPYHDYKLDTEGDTMQEVLIELAKKVKLYYNDDGSKKEGIE